MRDPQVLGARILAERARQGSKKKLSKVIAAMNLASVPDYTGGKFMSSDPSEHHSKTPQNIGNLYDGGGE